jgi:TM2 domain-containing membrane protein YozV
VHVHPSALGLDLPPGLSIIYELYEDYVKGIYDVFVWGLQNKKYIWMTKAH